MTIRLQYVGHRSNSTGKRGGSVMSSLMTNWEDARKVVEMANNSTGKLKLPDYVVIHIGTYLIAGNALEPYTTITGKLRYEGLTT